jgi:hypothetical protein
MRFSLGQVVATPGALDVLREAGIAPVALLARHARGDWGELSPCDAAENEFSLQSGFRLLSAYSVGASRIWIITEADRSATTLLLPSEY